MAVKGYTNSELAEKKQEKLVRLTWIIGALQLVLIAANVVLALLHLGAIVAIGSAVIYIVILGIYIRGADMLSDQGYPKIRRIKTFKLISIVLFALSFCLGLFSSMQ
jgi:uncharacterized membrane protein (DUF485 family)